MQVACHSATAHGCSQLKCWSKVYSLFPGTQNNALSAETSTEDKNTKLLLLANQVLLSLSNADNELATLLSWSLFSLGVY